MAASRWKRFAFFDRNNLTFQSEVMTDLIPTISNESGRLTLSFDEGDTVSMAVSTASLPMMTLNNADNKLGDRKRSEDESSSIEAMFKTLSACSSSPTHDGTLQLQSQAQSFINSKKSSDQVDGLVLVFCASQESDRVHCIDVTVRCHPISRSSPGDDSDPVSMPDDSLDGWRGYWTPFVKKPKEKPPNRIEDRIISDHLPSIGGDTVIDLAASRQGENLWVACLASTNLIVFVDPHLSLSCRLPLATNAAEECLSYRLATPWNTQQQQKCTCVDISSTGLIAAGTDKGSVHIFSPQKGYLRSIMAFSSPNANPNPIISINWSVSASKAALFCCHQSLRSTRTTGGGICCYELGDPINLSSTPLARHDLDSRPVLSGRLCDNGLLVARPDGIYTYSHTQKIAVSPIDGIKLAVCNIPTYQAVSTNHSDKSATTVAASSYALVASTDSKSGRDAVDIYDANNKLVAFHVLLSPSHKALQAAGIMVANRSSAIVLTSGGAIVTLTEKVTSEKVSLLTQKNLYGAAISMAYADPSYQPNDITSLYRRYAEHLYRKGSFSEAMDQYIYTIGALESSHVIFRYLDAPRIPMLVRYLEELRRRELATAVHNELLRTCYMKLGDDDAAERISAPSDDETSCLAVASLTHNPKEALAMVCSFEAPKAAEALVIYGAALARTLPRETAGVVVSLCLGTYSPSAMAAAAAQEASRILEYPINEQDRKCSLYPVHLFASAFLENPKMLRLILAHCNRNKCQLTPTLRRTLLELTLAEWNNAKRSGDTEAEKLRRKEAITALTDAHCSDIGDYNSLVLVQLAGFAEGELLLYERLQMIPMLLNRYAQDGGDRARRQMLAMCRNDPQILADVLGHFVSIASEKIGGDSTDGISDDGQSTNSQEEEILEDIRESLSMARSQGVLPPVRVARILAGEGTGQFSDSSMLDTNKRTVPLSVALDYVGDILDESRGKILTLQAEVEEYNALCNSMEEEVEALLSDQYDDQDTAKSKNQDELDIEDLYSRLQSSLEEGSNLENKTSQSREAFWRDMDQSDDRFETISRYFANGLIA
mmetsp:Transcript_22754/g.34476  ORF Transcript_22754/g.34476 Transcript_22754/m.34476 type:complete len:1057 (+) Transcript_22754:116-3286(+)